MSIEDVRKGLSKEVVKRVKRKLPGGQEGPTLPVRGYKISVSWHTVLFSSHIEHRKCNLYASFFSKEEFGASNNMNYQY